MCAVHWDLLECVRCNYYYRNASRSRAQYFNFGREEKTEDKRRLEGKIARVHHRIGSVDRCTWPEYGTCTLHTAVGAMKITCLKSLCSERQIARSQNKNTFSHIYPRWQIVSCAHTPHIAQQRSGSASFFFCCARLMDGGGDWRRLFCFSLCTRTGYPGYTATHTHTWHSRAHCEDDIQVHAACTVHNHLICTKREMAAIAMALAVGL